MKSNKSKISLILTKNNSIQKIMHKLTPKCIKEKTVIMRKLILKKKEEYDKINIQINS